MNVRPRALLALAIVLAVAGCVQAVMWGGMGAGMGVIAVQEIRKADRLCREAMTRMHAHLERLDRAGGDSLPALLPVHQTRLETLVFRCVKETSDRPQAGDTGMSALGQELRRDLTRLPDVVAEDPSFMAGHRARIERFLALRQGKGGSS